MSNKEEWYITVKGTEFWDAESVASTKEDAIEEGRRIVKNLIEHPTSKVVLDNAENYLCGFDRGTFEDDPIGYSLFLGTFTIGRATPAVFYFDTEGMLENGEDRAYDDFGDAGEMLSEDISHVSQEARDELQQLVNDWQARQELTPKFFNDTAEENILTYENSNYVIAKVAKEYANDPKTFLYVSKIDTDAFSPRLDYTSNLDEALTWSTHLGALESISSDFYTYRYSANEFALDARGNDILKIMPMYPLKNLIGH